MDQADLRHFGKGGAAFSGNNDEDSGNNGPGIHE
jgi:hypothetical protein